MPNIGNVAGYAAATSASTHTGSLTLGSGLRRKVVIGVLLEGGTLAVTAISFDGTSIIGNVRGSNPDINPSDTALKIYWYDYDVPSSTTAGAKTISVTVSPSTNTIGWHAWELLDAAAGGPESAGVGHAGDSVSATTSVTATAGATLLAVGLIHAATQTITFSGSVVERRENDEFNFTSACADAANVAAGTRSVTLTPSAGARNSVRLMSYADFVASASSPFRPYYITR